MHSHKHIDMRRTLKGPSPWVPYQKVALAILGKQYELSLTLCGDTLARRINRQHRKKTYSPNVLSFPYDQLSGEIFLNLRKAAREAHHYPSLLRPGQDRSVPEHTLYLFIHGCLHLSGLSHGRKMDALELQYLRQFVHPKK